MIDQVFGVASTACMTVATIPFFQLGIVLQLALILSIVLEAEPSNWAAESLCSYHIFWQIFWIYVADFFIDLAIESNVADSQNRSGSNGVVVSITEYLPELTTSVMIDYLPRSKTIVESCCELCLLHTCWDYSCKIYSSGFSKFITLGSGWLLIWEFGLGVLLLGRGLFFLIFWSNVL